jgi:hypothetical protein
LKMRLKTSGGAAWMAEPRRPTLRAFESGLK